MVIGHADGTEIISRWEEAVLGPRPTQAEIDAVDVVALQAGIEAKEAEEKARQEWLKTAQDEVNALKVQKADKSTALTLEERIAALEVWTKIPKVPK